jgi:hypothetical protein
MDAAWMETCPVANMPPLGNQPDWYTLRAVGQDEFDDVNVPAVPRKELQDQK